MRRAHSAPDDLFLNFFSMFKISLLSPSISLMDRSVFMFCFLSRLLLMYLGV